tara:strand:- start:1536 stop:3776 length:2241 start_codon:yes stop_codon:yes gene_type:complete
MSNRNGVWSLAAQYQAIADQDWTMAPGAPTGVSATAGNAQAEVSFTAPTFAGIPGTITQFKVTSSSGQTATGSSSPITVTGLTNGSGVTFTAQAQNAIGLGKASDASSSVTPLAEVISGLFQTTLWTGNASTQTITTGIDLSNKGGLLWFKQRTSGTNEHNWWLDSARTAQYTLSSNLTSAEINQTSYAPTFTSTGFSLYNWQYANDNNEDYVGWTFRKEPKFFDVVTYSGTGSAQNISHSLGSVPGMILVKRRDSTASWNVYHRGLNGGTNPEQYGINLNTTGAEFSSSGYWNNTAPTSTQFTVGTSSNANASGGTYVAYLFAHNNNDGGFGPDSEDIIKCGSYTGTGSSGNFIDLGFEPQWLLIKNADASESWIIQDNMRSMTDTDYAWLYANGTNDEAGGSLSGGASAARPTGFEINPTGANINASGNNYIYMAIRRPDQSTPTVASEVFSIDTKGSSAPYFDSNHIVDMALVKSAGATGDWYNYARLMGEKYLATNTTAAEANASEAGFDFMDGHIDSDWGGTNAHSWMWKRAKGYFDVVAYTGTGAAQTINHNLGAIPEMIWLKRRDTANFEWIVYHKGLNGGTSPEDYVLYLNTTNTEADVAYWDDTAPTSTTFRVSGFGQTGANGGTYIAYLFATVAGVSKVGSYTGNSSSTQDIDCGFTNGAKMVLLKQTSHAESWEIYDTTRALVAGNDYRLRLDTTEAQATNSDFIDPLNSGFTAVADSNFNGRSYIFYAIANDPS